MEPINSTYNISSLVDIFYDKINDITAENHKQSGVKRADIMSKDRKTFINNFNDVCDSLNRKPDIISAYIAKELKINTSITASGILIINGTYKKIFINDLIIKYIVNYVQCPICKSCKTITNKVDKINFIECKKCRATNAIDN